MIILFYGNQEVGRYIAWNEMKKDIWPHTSVQSEIYNGGYVYMTKSKDWYRCDGTPVLYADVPKELLTIALILGL